MLQKDTNENKEESEIIIFYNDGSNPVGASWVGEYNRDSAGKSLQKFQHHSQETQSSWCYLQQDRNSISAWSDYNFKSNFWTWNTAGASTQPTHGADSRNIEQDPFYWREL